MNTPEISKERVLEMSAALPGFPIIIRRIIDTVEDPDSNLSTLADQIEFDPLITSRVMALANSVAVRRGRDGLINDLHAATSMIGMESVKHIAINCAFAELCEGIPDQTHYGFIRHSLSVSASCKELVMHCDRPISTEMAQIAGLLHDIGHLWLIRFEPERFARVIETVVLEKMDIETAEIRAFGVSHTAIGTWLGEFWALPGPLISAIQYHHRPHMEPAEPLAAVTHVAEVLSHALALPGYDVNRVHHMSVQACKSLGIVWDNSSQDLFGRIEAASKYANQMLN